MKHNLWLMLGLHELSFSNLSESAANKLRRHQIRGAIEQMRVFVIGNTLFAPVLSFQAWNAGVNALVLGWTAIMLVFSWWLFFHWIGRYKTDGSASDMDRFVAETKVNASLWCLGMVLFYPFVEGDQKAILTTVMAGSLALGTVGFSQAPRAAFWYLCIQTCTLTMVPLIYGSIWGTASDLMISALALVAGLAIGNASLERARAQMRAFNNTDALTQKTEIVELLLKDYAEQGVDWVWRTDPQGKIVACPQQFLDMLSQEGLGPDEQTLLLVISQHIEASGHEDFDKVSMAFETRSEFHDVTLPLRSSTDGQLRWFMMRGRPQYEGTTFSGFRGIFADATTAMEAKKQVEFLAKRDPLTGLLNRNELQTRLGELKPQSQTGTAYLIDLDGFKQVNDSYGHKIGDELLVQVAQRLTGIVGRNGIVARLGGDEFLAYVDEGSRFDCRDSISVANQMLEQLGSPFLVEQFDIALSGSIGTAKFPADNIDGQLLLNHADLALYAAKRSGRNQCVAFVDSMQQGLQKRILVTERLRVAVKENNIVPFFQPQFCARSRRLVGFEALARWNDAKLGMVGPDIFVPIAEETGLIHEIGSQILMSACESTMQWSREFPGTEPTVAVNVSPVQVKRGEIVDVVEAVLQKTGLPAGQLEIEVTEGVLIDDMDVTRGVLGALSGLGVKIALDDFGTGYSSLSYIRALPLDRLKIDRSFISDIEDPEARSVVQAIIDLCRRLDLEVVAEGVETQLQAEVLRDMHCDLLQGYLLSRPLPFEQVEPFITGLHRSTA